MARKILLADDSVTAQNMGRKILTDAGYQVVAVNNGSAALKKLAEQKPDIIILDVYMPGYSGLEVCQRIKESRETSRIPVLLTVGKLEPFKPEEARRARADAFVVKPFEASELLAALAKLEQRLGPEPEAYKPGRFAQAVAAVEEAEGGKFGDSDGGWKARLRFPSKKKKTEEPEEVPEVARAARDSRELEAIVSAPLSAGTTPGATFERPMPAGLPGDITPEEIAAISAAAAQLSGASAADFPLPPPIPHPVDLPAVLDAPVTQQAPEAVAAPAEAHLPSLAPEIVPPALSAEEPKLPEPASAAISQPPIADAPTMVEAAVAAVGETAPVTLADVPQAALQAEPVSAAEPVAASMPQIPSPDSASMAMTETSAASGTPSEPVTVPEIATTATTSGASVASSAEVTPVEAQTETGASDIPVAAAHDAELMAALQTLAPAHVSNQPAAKIEEPTAPLGAIFRVVAEVAAAATPNGHPRWIAEAAVVDADEASTSLEKEMEKALAAAEAARLLASSALESLVDAQAGSSAAGSTEPAVAVMAAPDGAPRAAPVSGPPVAAAVSEAPATEVHAAEVFAMASAAGAGDSGAVSAVVPALVESRPPETEETSSTVDAPSLAVAAASESAASTVPEIPVSAAAAAEVQPEPSPIAESAPENAAPATLAPVGPLEDSHVEEIDPMDRKHSENLGFKMIRQSPAGSAKAAAKPAPVSKETFEEPAAAPDTAAMAAAAAAETAPAPPPAAPQASAAPDPHAIASIVDSVMAELRPKIVEEIARKLAEKKE